VFGKFVRWFSSSGSISSGNGGGCGGGGGVGSVSCNSTGFSSCICFTSLGVNEIESYTNRNHSLLHEEASNRHTGNCKLYNVILLGMSQYTK